MESFSQVTLSAAAPRHVPDLRPSADAAATRRIDQPFGLTATPAAPAPVTAQPRPVGAPQVPEAARPVERVLKPYGVQMLPATDRAEERGVQRDARRPDAPADKAEAPKPAVVRPVADETTGLDPRSRAEGQMAQATDRALAPPERSKEEPEEAPAEDA